jgi:hypothetical protein
MREFTAHQQEKRLLDLVGELEWDERHDCKSERKRA